MKIEIDMNEDTQSALMTFFASEFKNERDYEVALSYIVCVAADFELDPELDAKELKRIIGDIKTKEIESFVFSINEEGIEIDLE